MYIFNQNKEYKQPMTNTYKSHIPGPFLNGPNMYKSMQAVG